MSCAECREQTLHDKTVAQRLRVLQRSRGRRSTRLAASLVALGLVGGTSAAALAPAVARLERREALETRRATVLSYSVLVHSPQVMRLPLGSRQP
jgi:hypothetical protein